MQPLDIAWLFLKMPVVDTDVPDLRMSYQEEPSLFGFPEHNADQAVLDAMNQHPQGIIGGHPVPSMKKYGTNAETGETDWDKTLTVADIKQMTPNEYFNHLQQQGYDTDPRMVEGKEYRWPDKGAAHIQSIIDGIKGGQVMGMPQLVEDSGAQEGGHRMEALRQMGHGDTRVPVHMGRTR